MGLEQWAFSEAIEHTTGDGNHSFYRVKGERTTRLKMHGREYPSDYTGLWPALPVEGEGATPEEALTDAMRRAIRSDDRDHDTMWNAQVAIMGGTNFRRL